MSLLSESVCVLEICGLGFPLPLKERGRLRSCDVSHSGMAYWIPVSQCIKAGKAGELSPTALEDLGAPLDQVMLAYATSQMYMAALW